MKKILFVFIIVWITGCAVIFMVFRSQKSISPNTVAISDALMGGEIDLTGLFRQEYEKINKEIQTRDLKLQVLSRRWECPTCAPQMPVHDHRTF